MYKITEKVALNPTVTKMVIEAPLIAKKAKPGQFIIVRPFEDSERIPLTVAGYDREKGTVDIIFQIVGGTTMELNSLNAGDSVHDFVGPLGRATETEMPRFCFGSINLMSGVQLIPVMIGLFGFPEIIKAFRKNEEKILKMSPFHVKEGFKEIGWNFVAIVRSSLIGVGVGIIPGVGEDVGGWLSYWASKATSKEPETFGKGNPKGVISAESGNNACIGGAIIPVLSLAVPGSAPAAVLLAAFLMHGYRPGPLLMNETPEFLYQVCIYLAASAIIMWFFSLILARFTVRILGLKKIVLMPVIFVLCVVGSYVINYNMFDVKVMFVFGILGFIMSELHFPAAPFLLGVILGPMADSNLRRALNISNGSIMPMFERPICLVFMAMILVLILAQIGVFRKMKQAWKGGR